MSRGSPPVRRLRSGGTRYLRGSLPSRGVSSEGRKPLRGALSERLRAFPVGRGHCQQGLSSESVPPSEWTLALTGKPPWSGAGPAWSALCASRPSARSRARAKPLATPRATRHAAPGRRRAVRPKRAAHCRDTSGRSGRGSPLGVLMILPSWPWPSWLWSP